LLDLEPAMRPYPLLFGSLPGVSIATTAEAQQTPTAQPPPSVRSPGLIAGGSVTTTAGMALVVGGVVTATAQDEPSSCAPDSVGCGIGDGIRNGVRREACIALAVLGGVAVLGGTAMIIVGAQPRRYAPVVRIGLSRVECELQF
jgi:hypothetical protein